MEGMQMPVCLTYHLFLININTAICPLGPSTIVVVLLESPIIGGRWGIHLSSFLASLSEPDKYPTLPCPPLPLLLLLQRSSTILTS